ncbi:peptidoglycan-binding protein [Streptomyces sp. NPDC087659]|uniref:peptidoglycan-binding protein n=1 Tax=Streptomyces sp. NPDC087659 TaxID=3365801 RepID=UPI0038213BD6
MAVVGVGGWIAGAQMQSPADAAASHEPPVSGPVTVSVEKRKLTATVITQGAVEYGTPRAITPAGPVGGADAEAAQLVTKQPKKGARLEEGGVLMQISGRPVMVLEGKVPMYRTLGPGTSGDDVKQLQSALRRLGFDPGGVTGDYRQGTAAAVARWYESKGFSAQSPGAEEEERLAELESAVTSAQLALIEARTGSSDEDAGSDEAGPLRLSAAEKELKRANGALSSFRNSYGTRVPAGEIVFLPELPARVDTVGARLGEAPQGSVATVTTSDLVVKAVVPGADASTLRVGMVARVTTPGGEEVRGIVARLGADESEQKERDESSGEEGKGGDSDEAADAQTPDTDSGTAPVPVEISLSQPGPFKDQAGTSAKVTIEVGSSRGSVLAVPAAAVHTSADGQARVQVERDGRVIDVPVTVGLSAAGLVEVKPDGGKLDEQDRVVVGK